MTFETPSVMADAPLSAEGVSMRSTHGRRDPAEVSVSNAIAVAFEAEGLGVVHE